MTSGARAPVQYWDRDGLFLASSSSARLPYRHSSPYPRTSAKGVPR